jgi:hypothetical protein
VRRRSARRGLRLAFNLVAALAVASLALGIFLRGGRKVVRVAVAEPASRGPVQGMGDGGVGENDLPDASEEAPGSDAGEIAAVAEGDGGDRQLLSPGEPNGAWKTGALLPDEILRVVEEHRDAVSRCFGLAASGGRVVFAWDILPSGDVTSLKVVSRTGDARVAQCLLRQLAVWRFPAASSPTSLRNVPFVFAPAGDNEFPSLSEPRHYEPPRSKDEFKDLPF